MDNRPVSLAEPVTETPEVRAAREAHQKAWEEAARLASLNPDPMSDVYNADANKLDEEQSEMAQALEIISGVANQEQALTRYPNLPYTNHIKPNSESASVPDSIVIEAESRSNKRYAKFRSEENNEEEEAVSEPRGFFYNFDYPVPLIVANEAAENSETESRTAEVKSEIKTRRGHKKADQMYIDPKLEAEVAQYRLVPIQFLDSKKSRRSGGRRKRKSMDVSDKLETENSPVEQVEVIKVAAPIDVKAAIKPDTASLEIPVEIKIEETPITIVKSPLATEKETSLSEKKNLPTPAQTVFSEKETYLGEKLRQSEQLKGIPNTEEELRRIAENPELIDAVHDAQIHPKQAIQ